MEKYSYVCYYCGCKLTKESVNTDCDKNSEGGGKVMESAFCIFINFYFFIVKRFGGDSTSNKEEEKVYYTKKVPPEWYNAKRKHYFSKPKGDMMDIINTSGHEM